MSVSSLSSSTRDPIAPLSSPPRRRRQRHRRDDHEGGSSSPESSPIHRYDHRTHSDNDRDANGDDRHNHIISPITAMKSSLKPLDTGDNTNTSNNEQVNAPKKEKKRHGQFSQWWIISSFIIINHILAVPIILFYHHMPWQIFAWCGLTAWLALTGVTAGYHRLWSHRSYRAKLPLRIFLATIGTISFQGSIKWWVLRHRIHHRFTDTEEDPYSVIKGLWHAHIGWLLEKPKTYEKMDVIDMSDLNRDPVVEWQIKLIGYGYVLLGLIVPGMIGHYYGDMLGGIAWIGIMARILSWNGIWATNSIAHWYGDRPYDDQSTARGSFITAVICNGEGNHNYHHEFPKDYRHGVKWYEWDPTKWCIWLWYQMGQAYNLHRCHPHSIKHAELKVKENSAHRLLTELRRQRMTLASWGQPAELPVISDAEFLRRVRDEGKFLIKVDGYALDVGDFFQSKHPGGPKPLLQYRGRDATAAFHGVLNKHTQAAQHLAIMFRVARVQPEPRKSISSSS